MERFIEPCKECLAKHSTLIGLLGLPGEVSVSSAGDLLSGGRSQKLSPLSFT